MFYMITLHLRKGDESMPEHPSSPKELEEIGIDVVRSWFDGIKFLWRTPETRYLLKLIIALFGSMIIFYWIITILIAIFGLLQINDILAIGELLFIGWFLFILIELARFYRNDKKYKLFPEKNPRLKMKYWPSKKSKRGYKRPLFPIIFFGSFLFLSVLSYLFISVFIFITELFYILHTFFLISFIFILFLTAFITARGTIKTFAEKYVEKFQRQRYCFFILLPIPWILFIISYFLWTIRFGILDIIGLSAAVNIEVAMVLYGFIGILGLLALLKQDWRASYTASQISASYTFLFVVLIPVFIGLILDLLGMVVSLLAMVFFFIQGTLDKHGDDLRKYYSAWDKKLQKFHINSEEDIHNQTYDRKFDTDPLYTDVPNAYRNSILGLVLLLLICFGIIFRIGPMFAVMGTEVGVRITESLLIYSTIETFGITLSLFL